MDLHALARDYDRDGFVIVRQLLSAAEIAEISRQIEHYGRELAPHLPAGQAYFEDGPGKAIKALHSLEQHSEYFAALTKDPRFLRLVGGLWPDGQVNPAFVSFFGKPARQGSVTPAHQDNGFHHWNPPLAVELTIAIDASTLDNGALICQRGTHRLGLLPHRPSGVPGFSRMLIDSPSLVDYPEVALCMNPGDVALHHINTVHRSGPNQSDRSRRQLGIAYHNSLAQRDEAARLQYQKDLEALHQRFAGQRQERTAL